MPCIWGQHDTRNIILASLLPASVAIGGYAALSKDEPAQSVIENIRPSNWVLRNQIAYIVADHVALVPLGYASYLVYKDGGGFDYTDTTVALTLYSINIAGLAALIPAIKKKSYKSIATITAVNTVTAVASAFVFSKITKKAGLFLIPYAIWSGYQAFNAYNAAQKETDNNA